MHDPIRHSHVERPYLTDTMADTVPEIDPSRISEQSAEIQRYIVTTKHSTQLLISEQSIKCGQMESADSVGSEDRCSHGLDEYPNRCFQLRDENMDTSQSPQLGRPTDLPVGKVFDHPRIQTTGNSTRRVPPPMG